MHQKIDVFCIGTPQVTGDALGPLVGSMLLQHDLSPHINVVGTLGSPVTSSTYSRQLELLRKDAFVIAVDATVGNKLWTYEIAEEPTRPGGALNKELQPVGDISVKAYTGKTVHDMLQADKWSVTILAHRITTELIDLLKNNKKESIYSNIY
jgi:putative sporulation protein YyaC